MDHRHPWTIVQGGLRSIRSIGRLIDWSINSVDSICLTSNCASPPATVPRLQQCLAPSDNALLLRIWPCLGPSDLALPPTMPRPGEENDNNDDDDDDDVVVFEQTAHGLLNMLPMTFRTYCPWPFETVRVEDDDDNDDVDVDVDDETTTDDDAWSSFVIFHWSHIDQ